MICKDNQKMIDTLLRLKVDKGDNGTNNKIASYQYQDWKTRKANETKCVSAINELMNANQTQNKIASVTPTSKIGEVAEFQGLLKGLT